MILFPEVSTAYDSSAHEQHPQRDITLQ